MVWYWQATCWMLHEMQQESLPSGCFGEVVHNSINVVAETYVKE